MAVDYHNLILRNLIFLTDTANVPKKQVVAIADRKVLLLVR